MLKHPALCLRQNPSISDQVAHACVQSRSAWLPSPEHRSQETNLREMAFPQTVLPVLVYAGFQGGLVCSSAVGLVRGTTG